MADIDLSEMVPIEDLGASDDKELSALTPLAEEARAFLLAQSWSAGIAAGYMDRGWAEVLAVFYFELAPESSCPDPAVWVIVGDIPPAYMDIKNCHNGAQALDGYCGAMEEWISRVRNRQTVKDVLPVFFRGSLKRMPTTIEHAEMLASRIEFIREEILSSYEDELKAP